MSVSEIRDGLLRRMGAENWGYADVAAVVKRPDGSRYSVVTIGHFMRDDLPARSWRHLAIDVVRSLPSVLNGCPFCGHCKR